MQDVFPAGPTAVPEHLSKPSSAYKKRAWFAVACLMLFIVAYVSLLTLVGWQSYFYLSEMLQGGRQAFIYAVVGIGCAFLTVFLAKGLLFFRRTASVERQEIKRTEQPELFAFIDKLAEQAGAPKPHRVFLSPSVNACVFYDLSVLNLFVNSKKNLEIGLGLVNVLTLSEFKAVLAHEFGHFAQRSMAIGSWVYIAAQIADQIVYKRDALDKFLRSVSRWDIRIAWVGWLLSLIIWSFRAAIDVALRLVVLAQRSLSRQMEFQADLVAVSLTGSDELVHALHKLRAADDAWSRSLHWTAGHVRQGKLPHDLFAVQHYFLKLMSELRAEPHYFEPPAKPDEAPEQHRIFQRSLATPPKMWSTHPNNVDREHNAKQQYVPAAHDSRSAWLLFADKAQLEQQMLQQLFELKDVERFDEQFTLELFELLCSDEKFKPQYRGLYLDRFLTQHAAVAQQLADTSLSREQARLLLDDLHNENHVQLLRQVESLQQEHHELTALQLGRADSADGRRILFRGKEIKRSALKKVIKQVGDELSQLQQQLAQADTQVRSVYMSLATEVGQGWDTYLQGVHKVLHFAEHSYHNLVDANTQLLNIYQYVTADGNVSKREFQQLMDVASAAFWVLRDIHLYKNKVQLDSELVSELGSEWSDCLQEFTLPPPSDDNLGKWLAANDNWVEHTKQALRALTNVALDRLLATERRIADAIVYPSAVPQAPASSLTANEYPVFTPGSERPLKLKLSLWDRFILAEGMAATIARTSIAMALVAALFASLFMGASHYNVYLVNGFGTPVQVRVGTENIGLAPYQAVSRELQLAEGAELQVWTSDGKSQIDSIKPVVNGHGTDYIYNIAGASMMVEWTVVYGDAQELPPRQFGTTQWFNSDADYFFVDPPDSFRSKGKGAARQVLSASLHEPVAEILAATPESLRQSLIKVHLQWEQGERLAEWQKAAGN
jgi:Zn-dependent protease with chaperone function